MLDASADALRRRLAGLRRRRICRSTCSLASGRPFGHLPWRRGGRNALGRSLAGVRLSRLGALDPGALARRCASTGCMPWCSRAPMTRASDSTTTCASCSSAALLAGPRPLIFDIALMPRESSLEHTAAVACARWRGSWMSTTTRCAAASRAPMRCACSCAQLQQQRAADGRVLRAPGAGRAVQRCHALDRRGARRRPRRSGARRVLLAGSVPPDERLHRAVEGGRRQRGRRSACARTGSPRAAAGRAERVHRGTACGAAAACHGRLVRARSSIARSGSSTQAREARAAAVILWLTREDEGLAWHVPAQRRRCSGREPACAGAAGRKLAADDGAPGATSRILSRDVAMIPLAGHACAGAGRHGRASAVPVPGVAGCAMIRQRCGRCRRSVAAADFLRGCHGARATGRSGLTRARLEALESARWCMFR